MIVEGKSPELILLDVMMPGMDGFQVCQQLKSQAETRDIPIIFISALDEVVDKIKGFKVGGVDYITKPFQLEEVLVRVRVHLEMRRLQVQLEQAYKEVDQRVQERTAELTAANISLKAEIAERSRDLAEHAGRRTVKDTDVRLAVKEWRSR